MTVSNGQLANQSTFNNAYVSRTAATTSTVAELGLNNTLNPLSGPPIVNTQRAINKAFQGLGATDEADSTVNDYSSNHYVTNGDNRKVAVGKLDQGIKDAQDDANAALANDVSFDARLDLIEVGNSTFAGNKTFQNDLKSLASVGEALTVNSTLTGANQRLPVPVTGIVKVTNAGLTSISQVVEGIPSQRFVLINGTAAAISVVNAAGPSATENIITGTGASLSLASGASILLIRDDDSDSWKVVGGTGSGGGGGGGFAPVLFHIASVVHGTPTNSPNLYTQNAGSSQVFRFDDTASLIQVGCTWTAGSNNSIQFPTAGKYKLGAKINHFAQATTEISGLTNQAAILDVYLFKNNVFVKTIATYYYRTSAASRNPPITFFADSGVLDVAANDYFDIRMANTQNQNLYVNGQNEFFGKRVG